MAPGRMVPSFGLKPNRPTAAKTVSASRQGLGGKGMGGVAFRRHRYVLSLTLLCFCKFAGCSLKGARRGAK